MASSFSTCRPWEALVGQACDTQCCGREGNPVGLGSCLCALGAQHSRVVTERFLGMNISPV